MLCSHEQTSLINIKIYFKILTVFHLLTCMENKITVLNIYTDNWLKQSKGQWLNLRAFEYISLMTITISCLKIDMDCLWLFI
jgi:hypothetical protein